MIKEGSRVRHIDEEIDEIRGVMSVLTIKNGHALCAYLDFERIGSGQWLYPLNKLKLEK